MSVGCIYTFVRTLAEYVERVVGIIAPVHHLAVFGQMHLAVRAAEEHITVAITCAQASQAPQVILVVFFRVWYELGIRVTKISTPLITDVIAVFRGRGFRACFIRVYVEMANRLGFRSRFGNPLENQLALETAVKALDMQGVVQVGHFVALFVQMISQSVCWMVSVPTTHL